MQVVSAKVEKESRPFGVFMELKITVSEEVAHLLEQQAKVYGQDLNTFVETLLKTTVTLSALSAPSSLTEAEFEADMLAFAEGTENLPPYTGTYSREDIYFDHD